MISPFVRLRSSHHRAFNCDPAKRVSTVDINPTSITAMTTKYTFRCHLSRLITRAAHVIKDDPSAMKYTFIHNDEYTTPGTCVVCGDGSLCKYALHVHNQVTVYALCYGCYNRYHRLQEITITRSIMRYRTRVLVPRFTINDGPSGLVCILCCEYEGWYRCNDKYICRLCKIEGTTMLCVEVLLLLRSHLVYDLQHKITLLIWEMSVDRSHMIPIRSAS